RLAKTLAEGGVWRGLPNERRGLAAPHLPLHRPFRLPCGYERNRVAEFLRSGVDELQVVRGYAADGGVHDASNNLDFKISDRGNTIGLLGGIANLKLYNDFIFP